MTRREPRHMVGYQRSPKSLRLEARRQREAHEAIQRAEQAEILDARFWAALHERRALEAQIEAEAQRRVEQERKDILAMHEERIATGWWKGPSA